MKKHAEEPEDEDAEQPEEDAEEDREETEDTEEGERRQTSRRRKKQNRSFLIVGIFIVAIIAAILAMMFLDLNQEEQTVREHQYNGFNVLNISDRWFTTVQVEGKNRSHTIEMHYGPMEVDEITMDPQVIPTILQANKVYLTVDPDASSHSVIAMVEVGKFLGQTYDFYNIPSEAAFTKENQQGRKVITCQNATPQSIVLDFRVTNQTRVELEQNCILVQGESKDDIIRASNRLGYALAGII
ncbi:MAG: hypothetical protein ACQESG_08290 [Nanobdellota archaeon]